MPKDDKEVLIYHTGDAHGPMETAAGRLRPGQSLSVPKALADKLIAAYPHIRLTSDLVPGGAKAAAKAAEEKAKLEKVNEELAKENAELKAKLAEKGAGKKGKDAKEPEADAKKDEPQA